MAGTSAAIRRHVIGPPTVADYNRTSAPFSVRISANGGGNGGLTTCDGLALAEGPSCLFVGPIETASKETLEALYRQVRNYSLIFYFIFIIFL